MVAPESEHPRFADQTMKTKGRSTGFWEPGFSAFTNELARQEKALIGPLESELRNTIEPARKVQLRQQIADIKAEFNAKRKAARYSLFGKG